MLRYSERDGGLIFAVRVVPRASRSEVAGEQDGALRVCALPVDGAANKELIRTLARALKIPARDVEITSGFSSKLKQVRIAGAKREQLLQLIQKS